MDSFSSSGSEVQVLSLTVRKVEMTFGLDGAGGGEGAGHVGRAALSAALMLTCALFRSALPLCSA